MVCKVLLQRKQLNKVYVQHKGLKGGHRISFPKKIYNLSNIE